MLKKLSFHWDNILLGEGLWSLPVLVMDRILFYLFFKYIYERKFGYYGKNIRWGRNFTRRLIPSSVRISCPHKIFIEDHCCIDNHVYLQCHFESEGLFIGRESRINAHVHLLSYSKITLGEKVLIAPFVLLTSSNHGHEEDRAIMKQKMIPAGQIHIGEGTWIGQNAKVIGPAHISKNSVIASAAVVKGDFNVRAVIAGVPAKVVRAL